MDGDTVTVAVTKGDLAADYATRFDAANFGDGLRLAEFRQMGSAAAGTNITISVARGPLGDGFADVGFIDAANDLGKVIVHGDLNRIVAGDATPETPAIKLLLAQSMGRGAFDTVFSNVNGRILSMRILGDFAADLFVGGAAGSIAKLSIGGSLTGLAGAVDSGTIIVQQDIPIATILGSFRSSDATGSGLLEVRGKLGALTIGGALGGGSDSHGPTLHVLGSATSITIKGGITSGLGELNVDGSLDALTVMGEDIGSATIGGSAKKVTVTGDLGDRIIANGASIAIGGSGGDIAIGGSLFEGTITVEGSARSVTVGGDLDGSLPGNSFRRGFVSITGSVGKLTVGGSLIGGDETHSGGAVVGGFTKAVSIAGSLIGGTDSDSGLLLLGNGAGRVFVGGSLRGGLDSGGSSFDSGELKIIGNVASVTILGSLLGGTGSSSGQLTISGDADKVAVNGSIIGGDNSDAGSLRINGTAGTVFVGGSVIGGSEIGSGQIRLGKTKSFILAGSLISTEFVAGSITARDVTTFRILGDILAGSNSDSPLTLNGTSGSVFIGGDVLGAGSRSPTIEFNGPFNPADQAASVAVKSLTIRGTVSDAQILFGTNSNPDISAGTIVIGGDFRSSIIALGLSPGADFIYGTADDVAASSGGNPAITATLGKLIIGGAVSGNPASLTDRGAILAQAIGSIVIGGQSIPLGTGLVDILIGASLDVRVRELP